MPALIDETNNVYFRLTVKECAGRDKRGQAIWRCVCECGAQTVVIGDKLRSGHTESCGCLQREAAARNGRENKNKTHGHASEGKPTPTYSSWCCMIQRCTNPNAANYPRYGGRGITVCARWLNSFENFLADVGERPDGMTLDRYPDNVAGYAPGNVRWATPTEQIRNQRPRTRKAAA